MKDRTEIIVCCFILICCIPMIIALWPYFQVLWVIFGGGL